MLALPVYPLHGKKEEAAPGSSDGMNQQGVAHFS